jgi:hypothetical protein
VVVLSQPFSLAEVKNIVFSCNPNKSPDPDGFSFQFYQSCWDLIVDDVMSLINAFYIHELDLARINLASITLIPKKHDAVTITQFRPISLINCSMKILTKLLTERLSPDGWSNLPNTMLFVLMKLCILFIGKNWGGFFLNWILKKHLIESIGILL